jgi:maltooligosyltrehalose synthase
MPRAFYRIQFNRDCTFLQVTEHLPYLHELGISHCYASPYLTARPGSGHGYDIIDHSRLNPEIGTRKEYERFVAGLEENHLAQILDMVPNHMGVGPDNRWWLDVLENGQASPYADFFDINSRRGISAWCSSRTTAASSWPATTSTTPSPPDPTRTSSAMTWSGWRRGSAPGTRAFSSCRT